MRFAAALLVTLSLAGPAPSLAGEVGWSPSDPQMVTVTPVRGDRVKIVVERPGESGLVVKSGGASRKLTIRAAQPNGIWQVTITQ